MFKKLFGGIGSAAGGAANALSPLIGQLFSERNMKLQFKYNKQLAQFQNDLNVNNYKNRFQWAAEDAEKAGINRLYGLGQGSVSGAGLATVSQPDSAGMMGALQNANPIKAGFEVADWIRNFNLKKAQEKQVNQQTKTEEFNTQLRAYEAINQQIQNLKAQKELKWYDKVVLTELEQQRSAISANFAKIVETQERTFNIKEDTEAKKQETKVKAEAAEAANRVNKWHKDHPFLSGTAIMFSEMKDAMEAAGKAGNFVMNAATKGKGRMFNKLRKTNIK